MALEETLELDVANTMRALDALDAALVQLAQRFSVNLADAVDKGLQTPPDIAIDGAGITAQITDAVAAADSTATVTAEGLDVVESQVTEAITAGADSADTAVTITAEGLDNVGAEITAAVAGAESTVTVDADTEPAAAAIADLGARSDIAAEQVGKVTTSTRQLDVAAAFAAGDMADLREALPDAPVLTAVASGLAAVVVAATASFRAAEDAEIADRRLTATFGDLADEVQAVNIGGLSGDLTELATRAGSSDEALKLALSRIAELGQSAGLSDDQIVGFSRDIAGLSLRLAVVNPTLGDAGGIADRLTTALARGGRALAPYGLALSATAINARALADTGKTDADALNLAEKAAAGAALAVEQLGDNLGADFQAGADQTVISIRAIRQEFDNFLEAAGQPLLRPVVEEIRAGLPVIEDLAAIFAQAATDVLPLAFSLTRAAEPALHLTLEAVEVLSPAIEGLLSVIGAVPAPVLAAVGVFVALRRVTSGLGDPLAALGTRLATTVAYGGSVSGSLAGMISPVGLVTAGVASLVTIIGQHNAQMREERARIAEVTTELEKQDQTLGEIANTQAEKALNDKHQLDDLVRVGLTVQDVSKMALSGRAGFQSFLDTLGDTGEVSREGADELIRLTGEGHSLAEAWNIANDEGGLLAGSNQGLVKTFAALQTTLREAAQDTLTHAVATGKLSQEQVLAAEHARANIDGSTDYAKVLEDLLPVQAAAIEGQAAQNAIMEDAVDPAKAAADAVGELADNGDALATAFRKTGPEFAGVIANFRDGGLRGDEFANVLANTSLTADELKAALAAARDEQATFVDAFVQGIPRISGATAELARNHSLDLFLKSIHQQALDAAHFLDNIATLERRGADSLAQALAQAGIGAATEAKKAAHLSDAQLAKREKTLDADLALDARTADRAEALGVTLFDTTQATVDRIGGIKPPDLTRPILLSITRANSAAQRAAHDSLDIGITWGTSFAGGIGSTAPAIFRAAEHAARQAKLAAIQELEIHSPSRVGVDIGQQFVLGITAGLDDHAPLTLATSRLAQRMVLNVPATVVGGQSGGSAGPVGGGTPDHRTFNVYAPPGVDVEDMAWALDKKIGQAAQR